MFWQLKPDFLRVAIDHGIDDLGAAGARRYEKPILLGSRFEVAPSDKDCRAQDLGKSGGFMLKPIARWHLPLISSGEVWLRLGHDYRVVMHVVTWNGEGVLRLPVGALFRKGEDWAVFSVKDGRARTTVVKIGHRNNRMAEVLSGLSEDDRVVLHPSDRVKDDTPVSERDTADRMGM